MKENFKNRYSLEKTQEEANLMQEKISNEEAKDYDEAEKLVENDKIIKQKVEKIIENYNGDDKEVAYSVYEFMYNYFKDNKNKGEDFDKDALYSFCYQIMGKIESKLLANKKIEDNLEKQIVLKIITNYCEIHSMIRELKIPDDYKKKYGLSIGREQFFEKEIARSVNFLSSDELVQIILGDDHTKYAEILPLLNDFINNKDFSQEVLNKKEETVEKIKYIIEIFKIKEEKIKDMQLDKQKYILDLDLIRTLEIRSQIENKYGDDYLKEIVHICGTTRAEVNAEILFNLEYLEEFFKTKRVQFENMCWYKFKVSLFDET
jgi:hypothetical protein